jgi:hypothetical protein
MAETLLGTSSISASIAGSISPGFPGTHNELDQSAMFFSSKSESLFKIKAMDLFLVIYNT